MRTHFEAEAFDTQLRDTWVKPYHSELFALGFCHANHRGAKQKKEDWQSLLRERLLEITPEVVQDLLREPDWRYRTTGAVFCGLKKWNDFVPLLGQLLVKNELGFTPRSYSFALACCASPASVPPLRGHLNNAILRNRPFHEDVPAVLGTLMWVDNQLGTAHADDYTGLWRLHLQAQHHQNVVHITRLIAECYRERDTVDWEHVASLWAQIDRVKTHPDDESEKMLAEIRQLTRRAVWEAESFLMDVSL